MLGCYYTNLKAETPYASLKAETYYASLKAETTFELAVLKEIF